jgi:hypothetical protein
MQRGTSIIISSVYFGTTLQQHLHHLHMTIFSSIHGVYQWCATAYIIISTVVIGAVGQDLGSVHFPVYSSLKQIATNL